jgi:hypothetical protein
MECGSGEEIDAEFVSVLFDEHPINKTRNIIVSGFL